MTSTVYERLRSQSHQTVRPGHRPVKQLEKTFMYAVPSALVFDIASVIQEERMNRAGEARLIQEAIRGQQGRTSFLATLRRAFGGALIALGHSVHGKRAEQHDPSTGPSSGTLRLAR